MLGAALAGIDAPRRGRTEHAHGHTANPRAKVHDDLERGALIVIDVRSPEQYATEHIPGAINIPAQRLEELAPSLLPDRDFPVAVYDADAEDVTPFGCMCALGLMTLGYTAVVELTGGLRAWKRAGNTTATSWSPARDEARPCPFR